LAGDLFTDCWHLINRITTEKVSCIAKDGKAKHCKKFQHLNKAQHPLLPSDNRKTVVSVSDVVLEEAPCSALSKGLNYAVTLAVVPVEDMLCGVEKVVGRLTFNRLYGVICEKIVLFFALKVVR
jgi:hypothetical protein